MTESLDLRDVILADIIASIPAMLGVAVILLLYRWLNSDKYRPPPQHLGKKLRRSSFFIILGFSWTAFDAWFLLREWGRLGQVDFIGEDWRFWIPVLIVPAGWNFLGFYCLTVAIIEWRTGKEFPGTIHAVEPKPPQTISPRPNSD